MRDQPGRGLGLAQHTNRDFLQKSFTRKKYLPTVNRYLINYTFQIPDIIPRAEENYEE